MSRWAKVSIMATLVMAIATCTIAVTNYFQIDVMKKGLDHAREISRLEHMPRLKIGLGDALDGSAKISPVPTEDGGIRFRMLYYIFNVGDYPAYRIRYYHYLCKYDSVEFPNIDSMNVMHENSIFWPSGSLPCGYYPILRQQIFDRQQEGDTLYRHFFLYYEDELGNPYQFWESWRISTFTIDDDEMKFSAQGYMRFEN